MDFFSFAIPSLILFDLELSRIELPKLTQSILMEILIISFVLVDQFYFHMHLHMHKPWPLTFWKVYLWASASSYSFKVTCILLRQVISYRKMVMLSAKLAILISWSAISIPLILLLALMKLASTSAAIMYNSMEKSHPKQTPQVRVKGSDRRPFIWIGYWCMHLQPCELICLHIRTYGKQKS